MGGGAIPLEALRLGCETYSSDINPVAILIQKCIIEFPQKFGRSPKTPRIATAEVDNPLLKDVKKWSDWVFDRAFEEIGQFYPSNTDQILVGYINARTISCPNPRCGVEIPLMQNYWLARKDDKKGNQKKKIAVCPYLDGKAIKFNIVGTGYGQMPDGFDPSKGTVSQGTAVCIACEAVVDPKTLKDIFWQKKSWDKQIVAITYDGQGHGKTYAPPNVRDLMAFQSASKRLDELLALKSKGAVSLIPSEMISTPSNNEYIQGSYYWKYTVVVLYGMTRWKDLFNPRQILSMVTFTEKIQQAYKAMIGLGYNENYAAAVTTYLGILLDRLADKNSNLVTYDVDRENIQNVFGRQALQMVWHYAELNPFANNGWKNMQEWVLRVIEHCSGIDHAAHIGQNSATSLPYQDEYFDAVFTDPPYYDNIPYSVLSDFFYVWMKRTVGYLYPELFSSPFTPKSDEAISDLTLARGSDKDTIAKTLPNMKTKDDFKEALSDSFAEIWRVLKHDGVAVIVYAHKSTEGWETLIDSILKSGLVVTAAWPLHTEMKSRMAAHESAALSSSIYMIARKSSRQKLGFYRDIKKGMSTHVAGKLDQLWKQGISGADLFISAIGISMEVFAKYEKVIDDNDNPITALQLLDDVRKIVTDYALNQVLHSDFESTVSHMTRFYILWRWAYKHAKVPFDYALKLAQSVGVDIEQEYNRGFIHKEKDTIKVLSPTERKLNDIGSDELIDVLHRSVLLWKENKKQAMLDELKKSELGGSDIFYKVAQAVSGFDPASDESRLLDGFLSGRDGILSRIVDTNKGQSTLI